MGVIYMNQAEKIREAAINLLQSNTEFLEEIDTDSLIKGIKYSNLKKLLLESGNFSLGAIIGALGTLDKKVTNIHKHKTSKGVFFYYATNEELKEFSTQTVIIESIDYKDLSVQITNISKKVREILKNASNEAYLQVSDNDINYLRTILNLSNDLEQTLKTYENERTIEMVQDKRGSYFNADVPF